MGTSALLEQSLREKNVRLNSSTSFYFNFRYNISHTHSHSHSLKVHAPRGQPSTNHSQCQFDWTVVASPRLSFSIDTSHSKSRAALSVIIPSWSHINVIIVVPPVNINHVFDMKSNRNGCSKFTTYPHSVLDKNQ